MSQASARRGLQCVSGKPTAMTVRHVRATHKNVTEPHGHGGYVIGAHAAEPARTSARE